MAANDKAVILRPVQFHGDDIMACEKDGNILIDPKPVCERFGLDWSGQHAKLVKASEDRGWATMEKISMVADDGKQREQVLITLETFLAWLMTISTNRVREEYRELLRRYQKQAGRALREAFFPHTVDRPSFDMDVLGQAIARGLEPWTRSINLQTESMIERLDQHGKDISDIKITLATIQRRKKLSVATVREHVRTIHECFGGCCPCCNHTRIISESCERLDGCEEEHFYSVTQNDVWKTWMVCRQCNLRLHNDPSFRDRARSHFQSYQARRDALRQMREPLLPGILSEETV